MDPLIRVSGLRFRYPDGTEALKGVDFELFPGETVILLGANGSGKTTFALHLNGLLEGEGQIRVCGLPMDKISLPEIRRRVGMVFQDADEQLFMPTVMEDVTYGPLNLGVEPAEAMRLAREALEQTGMSAAHAKAPYHLSAGEKRRVAIAGVLAMRPDILILDEPTTSLDPPGQRDLVDLLTALPQSKIVTTHDIAFARAIGTRAVFFEKGSIAALGTVGDIASRFGWEPLPRG
ncbi:MAG: ABC transporter ATP-binding protein [Acidimicrobiia bacterium]|nr:ABC transporter ATP-binding protein [Acidimicrobiia bacterium]